MNNRLMTLVSVSCLLLILVISGEWFYAEKKQKKLLSPKPIASKPLALENMPSINLLEKSEQSYVDLVTRPLFIKGRRSVNEAIPMGVAPPVNFEWQLSGIYTSQKKGLYALLSRITKKASSKDNYSKITVDNELDGWKLAEILTDKIIFTQGETQKVLPLRKQKPKLPAARSGTPNTSIPIERMSGRNPPNLSEHLRPVPPPPPLEQPQDVPLNDENPYSGTPDAEAQDVEAPDTEDPNTERPDIERPDIERPDIERPE